MIYLRSLSYGLTENVEPRVLVDCNHMYQGQKNIIKPDKQFVRALRAPEGLHWRRPPPLPMAQHPVSAQPRAVSPSPSDTTAMPSSISIPVSSWSPQWTSSPHNLSPALPLAPAPFAPGGTTWIDHGPGSLVGTAGMAIDMTKD